jgi:peroxiredoxin
MSEAKESVGNPADLMKVASYVAFVVAAAAVVYSFVTVTREGELRRRCAPTCLVRPTYAASNRRAPDFTLKDLQGRDVSLSSLRGKVVVVNFWTKTCGPCLEEMPDLADLARVLKPMDDVAMLTVSTDEEPQDVKDTLKSILKEEPPFAVLLDPESKIVKGKYGTTLFPETWIIDKEGVIRARFDGKREWTDSSIVELVNQLRNNGYCPVEAQEGRFTGDHAKVCDSLQGG